MIKPSIRGGISGVSTRYAKANNKLMGPLYDPTKPSSYIMYVDANNLYGWSMGQQLPDGDFKWMTQQECNDATEALGVNGNETTREAFFGGERHYILDVELEYDQNFHDRDDDYPMAPRMMDIETRITGPKQHELHLKYYGQAKAYSRKLVACFLPLHNYVVLGELLHFYLLFNMKLIKVNRGISFTSSALYAPYIDSNTERRQANKDDPVLKDFFKKMNNSVYGRSIMNSTLHKNFLLFTDFRKARRKAEKPHCMDWRIFSPELIGVHMRKLNTLIQQPFQIGFAILEWSKYRMYWFYQFLKLEFGDQVRLLYTDTDSFFLQFFVDDLAAELRLRPDLANVFDFSEIPKDHPCGLGNPEAPNAGEVGYFKDECKGNPITSFIGLRPKLYSYEVMEAIAPGSPANTPVVMLKNKTVAKGISRENIRRLTHADYLAMYNGGPAHFVTNRRIGSKLHQVSFTLLTCDDFVLFSIIFLTILFAPGVHDGAAEARTLCV